MRVSYQGAPGAFSDLAMRRLWPGEAVGVPCATFDEALDLAVNGTVACAIIPVENAIAGPVHAAQRAIDRHGDALEFVNEVRQPIHLCLLVKRGVSIEDVRIVTSHPVALAQCGNFVRSHAWLTVAEHEDTAGAARDVARGDDRSVAAVASEAAAEEYGLDVIAREIEDMPGNYTRFVVLAPVNSGRGATSSAL